MDQSDSPSFRTSRWHLIAPGFLHEAGPPAKADRDQMLVLFVVHGGSHTLTVQGRKQTRKEN